MKSVAQISKRSYPKNLKIRMFYYSFLFNCCSHVNRTLCDLVAHINLIPLYIYSDLELGEVNPTTITLQLVHRSLTYPRRIVKDVLVKAVEFIFPTDFVILGMEEDQDIPLILRTLFFTTSRALIYVHKGEHTLRLGGELVILISTGPSRDG